VHNPWMLERRRSTRERSLRVVASGGGCGQQRDRRSLPAAASGLRTRCSTYSGLHKFLVNHHTVWPSTRIFIATDGGARPLQSLNNMRVYVSDWCELLTKPADLRATKSAYIDVLLQVGTALRVIACVLRAFDRLSPLITGLCIF
jgi:hypothetical protein